MAKQPSAEVRAALDQIDEIIAGLAFDERADVVNVLTALRGPDDEDSDRKWVTTAVIRAVALPKSYSRDKSVGYSANFGIKTVKALTIEAPQRYASHFEGHVSQAAQALGIEEDPNDDD